MKQRSLFLILIERKKDQISGIFFSRTILFGNKVLTFVTSGQKVKKSDKIGRFNYRNESIFLSQILFGLSYQWFVLSGKINETCHG